MFKKWLLTTVIAGSLVVCAVGRDAAAQSGSTMLHPNSNWAVSKLAASNTGTQPYCAIARRFSNNIVLTVASNAEGESSVAIDFQRQTLESGSSYQVVLDPGLEQYRSYSVRPVSGKAVVVRLGQDPAFHSALQQSGRLGVNLGGQSYSFHLPDVADGQTQLAGCLADMIQPAAGEPASLPAVTQDVAEPVIPALNNVVSEPIHIAQADTIPDMGRDPFAGIPKTQEPPPLSIYEGAPLPSKAAPPSVSERDLMTLREENVRLRNALERERRVYEDRFMQESQGSSQVAELNERLQILERENDTLRIQLNQAADSAAQDAVMATASGAAAVPLEVQSCPDTGPDQASLAEIARHSEAMAGVKREVAALLKENESLTREIEQQKAEISLLEQNVASATAAESVKNDTAAQDIAAKEAVIERLTSRVKILEEENLALKQTQDDDSGNQAVTLSQLRSLEEQLRYTQEDRDRLAQQINSAHDSEGQARMSIADSNWDLEQATARYNESEKEIRRLSRQLAEQRTQCAGEKKQLEYMLFDPDVADEEQVARLVSLEKQLADMTRLYEEKDALLKTAYVPKEQAAHSAQDMAAISNKVLILEKEKAALENDMRILQGERERYVQKVDTLEAALSSIQTSAGTMQAREVKAQAARAVTAAAVADQMPALHQQASYGGASISTASDFERGEKLALNQAVDTQPLAPYVTPVVSGGGARDMGNSRFITSQEIMDVLKQANIPVRGDIRTEQISGGVAYSWDTDSLFGSAEQKPMADINAFDDMAKAYLGKTESRCVGEFAAVPVLSMEQSGVIVSTYDIACIAEDGAASASVLFFNQNGMFNAFAHETGTESMDIAMDARDALAKLAFGSHIVMR